MGHCKSKGLYGGGDKSLARHTYRCILFDGKNISLYASLFIYMNSTNVPSIMIINGIYKPQNLCRCSLCPSWSG
jgi:hypothetical protein